MRGSLMPGVGLGASSSGYLSQDELTERFTIAFEEERDSAVNEGVGHNPGNRSWRCFYSEIMSISTIQRRRKCSSFIISGVRVNQSG